jgi:hypothetical protein
MGALAALAAAGAIAGATALAAKTPAHPNSHALMATKIAAASSASRAAGQAKKPPAHQAGGPRPFVNAVQRLVNDGTITAAEGQTVDRLILAGSLDPQALVSRGFTRPQVQATQLALQNAKRALGRNVR